MNLNDYVHLAIAKEAQETLRREPHEPVQAFDRRLDKYIHRRMKELSATLIALDYQHRLTITTRGEPPTDPDPEVA